MALIRSSLASPVGIVVAASSSASCTGSAADVEAYLDIDREADLPNVRYASGVGRSRADGVMPLMKESRMIADLLYWVVVRLS